jgi:hypothetical protein
MEFQFGVEHILGPVGALVIMWIIALHLKAALEKAMTARDLASAVVHDELKKEMANIKSELSHCQTQHTATMQELIKLSRDNGYLTGRLESLEKKQDKP